MASTSRFSYQRLIHEGGFVDDDDQIRERVIGKAKSWSRVRSKVHIRRRLRVRIPGLKRFFRRKARVISVTPTPLKYHDKSLKGTHDFLRTYSTPRISQ
ncbi:hypothetical protein RHSIM_Rhsim08G0048000 [Rhododendron simsii]|uniref:Uncharacterized protein n=1 Tax=Rhododendron simsii TaxID=118357 RepID=A0A834LIE3_RHOSS|nr:hypothetical protein RHSIM_Rhsim08G0048000 [Rhododendron simsii]